MLILTVLGGRKQITQSETFARDGMTLSQASEVSSVQWKRQAGIGCPATGDTQWLWDWHQKYRVQPKTTF